ncbi:hypothetical protein Rleg_5443 (plasmid) [Rhizobium leguminosarum bv. trifolii WSM1325]|uniref:Uncharacterized protein n=1 Tax=Rhizobium leguminosarum bv. trifolii (strain WSM1325) TaxID=395491 RepID=C6B8M7_RHILS|nr:hypothetical protein Rleg_5443 [Rhizobium leguminosarum bv. trifolii WSM1325]
MVGGFDPLVWGGVLGVSFDEGVDVGFRFCSGTVYAALQLLSRQLREPPFDLIDPGCRCWCEVNMPVWAARESGLDPRRLVGRIVVHHQMHFRPIRHFGIDPLQEIEEFSGQVTLVAMTDYRPSGNVERGLVKKMQHADEALRGRRCGGPRLLDPAGDVKHGSIS